MAVYKAPSRTTSKDSDKFNFKSNRSNSIKTDQSSTRSQGSSSKLKQKLITSSFFKPDESSKTSSINSTHESKDSKKVNGSLNSTNKNDSKSTKASKDTKGSTDSSNKNLKQSPLSKTTSFDTSKKLLSKSLPSSIEYEDSDDESETSKTKSNKNGKKNGVTPSVKNAPVKLSTKRSLSDTKPKGYNTNLTDGEYLSHEVVGLNHDEDLEYNYPHNKIAYLNDISKNHSLNSSLVNGSSVDTLYSNLNGDDYNDKMNYEFRFKRSKRSHYKLQDSILNLISKYQSDLEHLDDKIKSLESQFFSNPPEATGLIKGWEGNVLNNAYANISTSLKSRRALNAKFKANFTQTQNLITEHIFSLTSSTCAVSRMLLNG